MVRTTSPVRRSTRSRIARAVGETLSFTSKLTFHQMMLEIAGLVLGDRPAANRHSGAVNGIAVAADEIMPVGERLALGAKPVGAGRGQPGEGAHLGRGEPDAVRDIGL